MTYERYAIYWVPAPSSPLAAFARDWFGAEVETGEALAAPRADFGLDAALVQRATASPRRYGIHATIKAPFRLREGASAKELAAALGTFCSQRRRIRSAPLCLHRFSRYLALVVEAEHAEIAWLADSCVTYFDHFRAALNGDDRSRRSAALPPSAAALFEQFGYHDIFHRFMFHITLAGPLEEAELEAVEAALAPAIAPLTAAPFVLEDLCLCGDPGPGSLFRVLGRFPLLR
jgi:hypothetical protein